MPNWLYLAANVLYHLGLALWIGGVIALGALTAPALFRALPRPQAGSIFGPILRRFARLRLVALALVLAGAGAKYFIWESHATSTSSGIWIAIRWAAIAVMAATLLYEILHLERAIEARRRELTLEMPDDDPRRRAFNVLHKRAENLMRLSLLAALIAEFLS